MGDDADEKAPSRFLLLTLAAVFCLAVWGTLLLRALQLLM